MANNPYWVTQQLNQLHGFSFEDFDPADYDIERDGDLLDVLATKFLCEAKVREDDEASPLSRDILNLLNDQGPLPTPEIANLLNRRVHTVYSALLKLASEEKIEVIERGFDGQRKMNLWASTGELSPSAPMILTPVMEISRLKREILTEAGTPDPSVVQGIFHRPHRETYGGESKAERDSK